MPPHASTELLFNKFDWFSVESNQRQKMLAEIDGIDGDRLLNTSLEDLSKHFDAKYLIDVPVLHEDRIVADQQEVRIDVSQDSGRYIRNRDRPFHVAGTAVEITVPFSGEPDVFRIQPTTFTLSPPRAIIETNALRIIVQGTQLDAERVRSEIASTIASINSALNHLRRNQQVAGSNPAVGSTKSSTYATDRFWRTAG